MFIHVKRLHDANHVALINVNCRLVSSAFLFLFFLHSNFCLLRFVRGMNFNPSELFVLCTCIVYIIPVFLN